MSVLCLAKRDLQTEFDDGFVEIVRKSSREVVQTGYSVGKLYFLEFEIDGASEANLIDNPSYDIVHRRFAHLNESSIIFLKKNGYIQCSVSTVKVCDGCMMGKQYRLPHHSREEVSKNPLDLIVSDVCAVESPALNGERYFVTFLDDCTHFSIVYPIVHKSEVTAKFKEFIALAENHFDRKIKRFRSDNGREY